MKEFATVQERQPKNRLSDDDVNALTDTDLELVVELKRSVSGRVYVGSRGKEEKDRRKTDRDT